MPRSAANNAANAGSVAAGQASQYGGNAAGLYGPLTTQAKSLINSTGYDPTTLSAITNNTMGASNAAFGGAASQINRDAARRGNVAGTAGELDTLARDKGLAGGQEAGDIQIQNAQYANRQRMAGLNLLNSLYGTNVNAQLGEQSIRTGDINARTQASPGWAQTTAQLLSGVGGAFKGGTV